MLIRKLSFAIVATLMTMSCVSSYASTPLQLDSLNPTYIQQEPIKFDGNNQITYSGAFTGTLGSQASNFFFCVDLRHLINLPGNYSVDLVNPNVSLPAFMQLGNPFNMQVAASLLNHADIPSFGTDTAQYTAMQLALWSIVYNWTTSYHPTNTLGSVTDLFSTPNLVDPTILANAYGFLGLAETFVLNNTYSSSYGNWRLLVNSNNTPGNIKQVLIGVTTPEPETYLIMATFLGIGMLRFRKKAPQTQ